LVAHYYNLSFSPTPKVEWVKIGFNNLPERVVVERHGKLLTVEMVNEEDDGKYMCRAKNPHGEVVHYFHVTVEGESHYLFFITTVNMPVWL